VLKRLEELIENEQEAWHILVECGTGVGLGLSKWLTKCGNTSFRYVYCARTCVRMYVQSLFLCVWGLCVLMYANV
jgi:hypothetical protein